MAISHGAVLWSWSSSWIRGSPVPGGAGLHHAAGLELERHALHFLAVVDGREGEVHHAVHAAGAGEDFTVGEVLVPVQLTQVRPETSTVRSVPSWGRSPPAPL